MTTLPNLGDRAAVYLEPLAPRSHAVRVHIGFVDRVTPGGQVNVRCGADVYRFKRWRDAWRPVGDDAYLLALALGDDVDDVTTRLAPRIARQEAWKRIRRVIAQFPLGGQPANLKQISDNCDALRAAIEEMRKLI